MRVRFAPGDHVRVVRADLPGHIRTPYYIRGKVGVVECDYGDFLNPEELAYGRSGKPKRALYQVSFAQSDVWGDYTGGRNDTVNVEIFEHWLISVQGRNHE